MVLHGQRCTLRGWRNSDAASIVRNANNINVARHLRDRFPHPYTLDDAQGFLRFATGADPQTNFAIEIDRQACGGIGYVPGTDVERYSAEVGYWLGEDWWGRGIATDALTMFTEYAFAEVGFLRLFAIALVENVPSIRVLEKAGYEREGTMRSSCVKYGVVADRALYAKVNPQWSPKQ